MYIYPKSKCSHENSRKSRAEGTRKKEIRAIYTFIREVMSFFVRLATYARYVMHFLIGRIALLREGTAIAL